MNQAFINFTINPTMTRGYKIHFTHGDVKKLHITFIGTTADIFHVVKCFKQDMCLRDVYLVHINYKACPLEIRNSKKLKSKINRLFGGTGYTKVKFENNGDVAILESQAQYLYDLMTDHIAAQEVKRHPSFDKLHSISGQKKVKNYMESILNVQINTELFSYILQLFD